MRSRVELFEQSAGIMTVRGCRSASWRAGVVCTGGRSVRLLEQPGEDVAHDGLEVIGEAPADGPRDVEARVPLAGAGLLDQMGQPRAPHLFLAVDRRRQSGRGRIDVVCADAPPRRAVRWREPRRKASRGGRRAGSRMEPPTGGSGARRDRAAGLVDESASARSRRRFMRGALCQSRMWSATAERGVVAVAESMSRRCAGCDRPSERGAGLQGLC